MAGTATADKPTTTGNPPEKIAPEAPAFEIVSVDTLPKSVRQPSAEDKATADALFAATKDGEAVRSTTTFPTKAAAEKVGSKMRRLLGRSAPAGKSARSRIVGNDREGFRWAVFLGTPITRKRK